MPLTVAQLISNRLNYRLSNLQNLEAFNHRGAFTTNVTPFVIKFPYQNWQSTPTPLYRKNGILITPDVSTDLVNGLATFSSLDLGDNIDASYTFQYFTQAQLTSFFLLGMQILNNQPPASLFTLDDPVAQTTANYPVDFEAFLTNYAYKCCLETVLMDLMTWKAKFIFTDPQLVASTLQGFLGTVDQTLAMALPLAKGRRFLTPRSTSIGNFRVSPIANDYNFQQFTVLGTGGQ